MVAAYVGLGANLGDRAQTLRDAVVAMDRIPDTRVQRQSSLYATKPVGADGPDFVNAVVEVHTTLGALDLLHQLQAIESAAGRKRPFPNAPRTLDLDLLLYGIETVDTPALTVPHPRMFERAFVLVPLAEIAPQCLTPQQLAAVAHQSISRL